MELPHVDIQSRFVTALRTQASHNAGDRLSGSFLCPYAHDHSSEVFQTLEQLLNHTRVEHASEVQDLDDKQGRLKVRDAVVKARQSRRSPDAFTSGTGAPDVATLSLDAGKERQTSPSSGKKRRAQSDIRTYQKKGSPPRDNVAFADPDYSRDLAYTMGPNKSPSKITDTRLYNPRQGAKGTLSSRQSNKEQWSDRSADASSNQRHLLSSTKQTRNDASPSSTGHPRQAGILEIQKHDSRFPGLLLQPDSRPISQEQLGSEVKSIYAGLTMVETKCIHVDRAQAAVPQDSNQKLAPDHWQALIALHRTLLHEHHDFFLASQHPSASPALRRLAAKYTMPARMWKHGIHSFLELLRRRLPESLDYMLAFIYLSYQMMALLYETVPAFEDTWIECLGDLGRYRMAIEDEDIRDRETWANVARSWYMKAADRNPPVGRLYHHLAILARPNALHQIYYYARSLSSVEPFPSARESIMTLFDPVLGRSPASMSAALPIDASFIKAHAYTFEKDLSDKFETARGEYFLQLDNHIGRVTAKWKEQGVYTAVTNIASWFDYGFNMNIFRQLFLLRAEQRKQPGYAVEARDSIGPPDADLQKPKVPEEEIVPKLNTLLSDTAFNRATCLTNDTFSLVLRRIGDKNVLPHVHVMLSFFSTLASIEYVTKFLDNSPWSDIAAFLNTLVKTENQQSQPSEINASICQSVFPLDQDTQEQDELPLPEDYLIRGLIWAQEYLPAKWFDREHDEEDRYLELASTAKRRAERVLRLGHQLAIPNRWMSYDEASHAFTAL
ncbi:hypothetical protein C7974DRAFT_313777 [Boeremia exigua]|uniref:uncharacterized protein n=1 Tax=Boeremia exigua TaxID=749465 RepID=UPI001E8E2C93|nr:uncharacterized protein C7974DRAFT_313777 [Boeremia exigua]KAH6625746.1 hypothetical protein C7974DRAFT_313777 [Boeremia exigua]